MFKPSVNEIKLACLKFCNELSQTFENKHEKSIQSAIQGHRRDLIHHFPSYNSHHFNIPHRRTEESPVAEHFNGEGHTLADMTVVAIDQLYSHDP